MSRTWTVILAGGIGSRFWPMSTSSRPKQLLPLVTGRPMLVDTFERLEPLSGAARTLVLTSGALAGAVHAALPSVPRENIITEPRAAGTAAALTWAAELITVRDGADAVMLAVHADWAIGDVPRFQSVLREAALLAESTHHLVTVGIVPRRADSGLGYIVPGAVTQGVARHVESFIEKPEAARAAALVAGGALWNSGIFAWCAGDLIEEVRVHCPEIATSLAACANDATRFFGGVTVPISIDVGVLERSSRVLVIPGDFGWSDVGTWAALRDVRTADADGNVLSGSVQARDSRNNVVHASRSTVVLFGVSDLVVVVSEGITLVTTVQHATQLKSLLDSLPAEVRNP